MTALLVIAILVLLIVVHELGHFIAAKLSGVKVKEFGVGYPPRAFIFGKFGGTEYTLNWIPFGGFVRLFGDEGKEEHGSGSFIDAARWKQATILVAGVCMNAIAAYVLFALAFYIGFPQPVALAQEGETTRLIIAEVVDGSPAYAAALAVGDEITSVVSGSARPSSLTPQEVTEFVRDHPGRPIDLMYLHEGVEKEVTIRPAQGVLHNAANQPALGIALALVANRSLPLGESFAKALPQTLRSFGSVGRDLGYLFKTAIQGAPNLSGVVGPIGIVGYVGDAAQNGIGAVLVLAALISVNLAIINLIPVPALDGGRLLVLGIESGMRRAAPRLAIQALNALGVFLIIVIMITVTYNDIGRLLG